MEINLDTLEIEIVDVLAIENGVEVFARAWTDGKQIGFGKDGTVDIERFRIINPPILVPDENGDIVREWLDERTQEIYTYRFREDAQVALLQVIEQNISVMKNVHVGAKIKSGKVGNTTSTFYPDASPESTSVDGFAFNAANANWNTAHDATSGSANDAGTAMYASSGKNSAGNFVIYRMFLLFDTSALPDDDVISSATLSTYINYAVNGDNDGDDWVNVVQSSPASNTALVGADFDNCGAVDNPTEGATRHDITGISSSAYLDFALNATGISWIAKTGVSKFGIREGHDALDIPYAGSNSSFNEIGVASADYAGTTRDPKLVIEHAAGGGASPRNPLFAFGGM
jgi:hypothetical protein